MPVNTLCERTMCAKDLAQVVSCVLSLPCIPGDLRVISRFIWGCCELLASCKGYCRREAHCSPPEDIARNDELSPSAQQHRLLSQSKTKRPALCNPFFS